MLYVSWSFQDIFSLVLVGIVEFFKNVIYKNSNPTQVILQKDFEISLGEEYKSFSFYFQLTLLLSIQSLFLEKHGSKKNLVVASKLKCGKKVFVLLDEIVKINMWLALINVFDPKFQTLLRSVLAYSLILATSRR